MPKPRFASKQAVKREKPVSIAERIEEEIQETPHKPELEVPLKGQPPRLNARNIMSLQQTVGNQAVQRYINQSRTTPRQVATPTPKVTFNPALYQHAVQRGVFSWIKDKVGGKKKWVVEIGDERVQVSSKEEEVEAAAIIKRIKDDYNITLGDQKPIEGIRHGYEKVPEKVKSKLKQSKWKYKELVAMEKGLTYYAPILGTARATNETLTKGGKVPGPQDLEFIGKLKNAIDKNHEGGSLDTGTLGEYFSQTKSVALFSSGSNFTSKAGKFFGALDFPSVRENVEVHVIHEVAHAVFGEDGALPWKRDLKPRFWNKDGVLTKDKKAEQPVTTYGKKNHQEDMCETMMFYFKKRGELQAKAPQRFKFAQDAVKEKGIEEA